MAPAQTSSLPPPSPHKHTSTNERFTGVSPSPYEGAHSRHILLYRTVVDLIPDLAPLPGIMVCQEWTDLESEHTHYSHLARAVIDKRGTMGVGKTSVQLLQGSKGGPPTTFHHQLKLPLSTCSSGGTPVTVGQIVDLMPNG